jgi:p-methyltransferase
MQQSGCKGVFLGIESGSQTILNNMNKFSKIERYKYGIQKLKARDIVTFASVILGFPGETEETIRETMEFIEESAPMFYRAELYYHYTNVPIHQQAEKYGLHGAGYSWKHNSMDWSQAADWLEVMYKTIKNSTVVPGYMFDFWSIPYLMGKGIQVEQILEFTKVAQELLIRSFDDVAFDTDDYRKRLASIWK